MTNNIIIKKNEPKKKMEKNDRTEVIYLAFLKYDNEGSYFENMLLYVASCLLNNCDTDGILHVEIVIPKGRNRYCYYSSSKSDINTGLDGVRKRKMNCSTDTKNKYNFMKRGSSKFIEREGYLNFLEIKLTKKEKEKIQNFLDSKEGKPFNTLGWYINYLWITKKIFGSVDKKGEAFTCSEFVWLALKSINLVDDNYNCYEITPQQIYDVLLEDKQKSYRIRNVTVDEMMGYLDEKKKKDSEKKISEINSVSYDKNN